MSDPESSIKDSVRTRLVSYLDMLKASSDRFNVIKHSNEIVTTMKKLKPIMGNGVNTIKDIFCDYLTGYIKRNKEMFQNPITSNVNITSTHDLLIRSLEIACTYARDNSGSLLLHDLYEEIIRVMENYRLECHGMEAGALTQMTIRGILCSTLFQIAYSADANLNICPRCNSLGLVSSRGVHTFVDMPDAWCGVCQSYFILNKYNSFEYITTVVGAGIPIYDIIGKDGSTLLSSSSISASNEAEEEPQPPSPQRGKTFTTSFLS